MRTVLRSGAVVAAMVWGAGFARAADTAWTVLFRSDNSSQWNTTAGSAGDANGFAIPMSDAASACTYVRVKRMDTGEAVIVPVTPAKFATTNALNAGLLWANGNQTWQEGDATHRTLGIGVYAEQHKDAGEEYVVRNKRGDFGYGGYGFGKAIGADGQTESWDGKDMGKVVLEIAVTLGELTPAEEREELVPGKLVVTKATFGTKEGQSDVTGALRALVKQGSMQVTPTGRSLGHVQEPKGSELAVTYTINGEEKTSHSAAGKALWLIAPPVHLGEAEAKTEVTEAPTAPTPTAAITKDENGWVTLFRGSDPSLWNTAHGEATSANGYAIPLKQAPATILCVRIRRMDTGEGVMLPLNRAGLEHSEFVNRTLGWTGGDVTWNDNGKEEKLVGIAESARHTDKAGDGYLWMPPGAKDGLGGYGFGRGMGAADGVHELWGGRELPAKTVLEISVKTTAVTEKERGDMLIPGRIELLSAAWGDKGEEPAVLAGMQAEVHPGYMEVKAGQPVGEVPAGKAKAKAKLSLTYRVNGIAAKASFEAGADMLLVAPAVKVSDAGPLGTVLSEDEISVMMDAGLYRDALAGLARTIDTTKAGSWDRHELLMLKGDCELATKDRSGALMTFGLVQREATTFEEGADGMVMAYLVQHAQGGVYHATAGHGTAISVTDRSARTVLEAMFWEDEQALAKKTTAGALAGGLPAIAQAGPVLQLARAAELTATGAETVTMVERRQVGEKGADLVRVPLQKEMDKVEQFSADALQVVHNVDTGQSWHVGLSLTAQRQLPLFEKDFTDGVQVVVGLMQEYGDVVNYQDLGKSVEKGRDRAKEVLTRQY